MTTVRSLPEKGRDRAWLEEEWKNLKALERGDVDSGRVSGTVYHVCLPRGSGKYCKADMDRVEKN